MTSSRAAGSTSIARRSSPSISTSRTCPAIVVLEEGRVVRKVEGRVSVGSIRDALSPWLH